MIFSSERYRSPLTPKHTSISGCACAAKSYNGRFWPGSFRDYVVGHPSRPVLVVEVSESSLALDRDYKGSLYARAGLADYWILNLVDRVLEVHRDPGPDLAAAFGWRYRSVEVLTAAAVVAPLASSGGRVPVIDLLP